MDNPRDADSLPDNWTHAGRVLRSVTHDVNNHLGAILAFAELIAMAPNRATENAGMAKEIVAAVRDSAAQMETVAAIVSDDLVTIETIHLNELLPRVASLFRYELDRNDSGIDIELPKEVCAFPGVRARFVRALTHIIRYVADRLDASKTSNRVAITLVSQSDGFVIEVGGNSNFKKLPDTLAEAREHVQYHHGKITCERPGWVCIEIPRDTRLFKVGAGQG